MIVEDDVLERGVFQQKEKIVPKARSEGRPAGGFQKEEKKEGKSEASPEDAKLVREGQACECHLVGGQDGLKVRVQEEKHRKAKSTARDDLWTSRVLGGGGVEGRAATC